MTSVPPLPDLRNAILERIDRAWRSISPQEMGRWLRERFDCPSGDARRAITSLINENRLSYREKHGRVILEPSFHRPVHLSSRIVVAPPGIPCPLNPGEVAIRMNEGASFGIGQHPTTRLCIEAIDRWVPMVCERAGSSITTVLDVGTGSGILGIAALQLGIDTGLGIDIDPCALSEATQHARLNGLEDRFEVADTPLDNLDRCFSLIIVNLRLPTLRRILPVLTQRCTGRGMLILSGIRPEERPLLETSCAAVFDLLWYKTDRNWSAAVFAKKA